MGGVKIMLRPRGCAAKSPDLSFVVSDCRALLANSRSGKTRRKHRGLSLIVLPNPGVCCLGLGWPGDCTQALCTCPAFGWQYLATCNWITTVGGV